MFIVIKGATLIDGTGGAPLEGAAVAIEGEAIKAIGREEDFGSSLSRDDTRILEASGKYIMPGLINMHEHLWMREAIGNPLEWMGRDPVEHTAHAVRNALVALRRGWTTVCEMGSVGGISLKIRDLINKGQLPGPRVIACGAPLSMTGGHAYQVCVEADGADACRRAAREQLKAGADFIKVMASEDPYPMKGYEQTAPEYTLEEVQAAFEEAHKRGKITACHVMGATAIATVLEAAVDMIEHGIYLNQTLAERMVQQGTYLCPTLSAYGRQTMNPKFQRGESWAKAHSVLVRPHQEAFRAAVTAGVKVVTGTDTTGSYAEEVQLMRDAGVSAMDTLQSCTLTAAQALGWEDRIGSIQAGKLADIVVLDGDPLADATALEQVHLVVKGGVVYHPETITL